MSSFKASTLDTLACPVDELYVFLPDDYKVVYDENFAANYAPILDVKSTSSKSTGATSAGKSGGGGSSSHEQKGGGKLETASIAEKIDSLLNNRTKVTTQSREKLLQDIFVYYASEDTNKSSISDKEVEILIKSLKESRSDIEFFFVFKTLIAVAILFVEDYGSVISTELFDLINKKIRDDENNSPQTRAYLVVGYFTLYLALNAGSHVGDIDNEINTWLSFLEKWSSNIEKKSDEVKPTVAVLNGLSILLSLITDTVELNENIEALIPSIVLYLNDSNPRIAIPAGVLIAQCFQRYKYDPDFDEDTPYYEKDEILDTLNTLTKESSKKLSKTDKKQLHVAFRDISNSVEHNFSVNARNDAVENGHSRPVLGAVTLSKREKIQIFDWDHLPRVNHLRWIFGGSLSLHMLNDTDLLALVREERDDTDSKFSSGYGESDNIQVTQEHGFNPQTKVNKKKKDIAINKARLQKEHELGLAE